MREIYIRKRREDVKSAMSKTIDRHSFSHMNDELIIEVGSNSLLSIRKLAAFVNRRNVYRKSEFREGRTVDTKYHVPLCCGESI